MDLTCLDYRLTEQERVKFEQDGFFVVEDVLPPQMVLQLTAAVDRLDAYYRKEQKLELHEPLNLLDFVGKDEIFLELLDWPKTFAKVWEILGWHIQLYHSHTIITPPFGTTPTGLIDTAKKSFVGWHQDTGRLNIDLETNPRPRISLKVAYYLSDATEIGRGNFYVIPGSHLRNEMEFPADGITDPAGSVPVRLGVGDAVFFDRRLWHRSSSNESDITRKVLFYGYSHRWLRPRDEVTVSHVIDRCDPIRQQLLGASIGGAFGYTSPKNEDIPLRTWIKEHVGEDAVAP